MIRSVPRTSEAVAPKTATKKWTDVKQHRSYFDEIAKELNIQHLDDWYKVKASQIAERGGISLLKNYYDHSLIKALAAVYPENSWIPWMHETGVPKGYWDNIDNQRSFLDWYAQKNNFTSLDDWYHCRYSDVIKAGGRGLMNIHHGSISSALQAAYPNHNWLLWRFHKVPNGFWASRSNVIAFLNWIAQQCGVNRLDDWYHVSNKQFLANGGGFLLQKYGGIIQILQEYFPHHEWRQNSEGKTGKTQTYLYQILRRIFPTSEVFINYKHKELLFEGLEGTNREMELDVFIPQFNLAFEYQGEYHYYWNSIYGSPEKAQNRDNEKRRACNAAGITLIEIPFWWDRSKNSILATIHSVRPDLVPHPGLGLPIPKEAPARATFSRLLAKKARVQQLLLSTAAKWNDTQDPTGWWVSPKINGIRCFWNGKDGLFLRDGTKIQHVPSEFLESLPSIPLDGELFCTDYEHTWKTILEGSQSKWSGMKYYVFDTPTKLIPYEERQRMIESSVIPNSKVEIIKQTRCKDQQHLEELLNEAKLNRLEGIILRKPSSHYFEEGSFAKKEFIDSEEALVVSSTPGLLECKLPDGKVFQLTGAPLLNSGTVISFTYFGVSPDGIPLTPKFLQFKPDLPWSSVLLSRQKIPFQVALGSKSGTFPKCRGCYKRLRDRNQLRLEVKGAYTPANLKLPHPIIYRLCLNVDCVKRASERYVNKPHTGVYFPQFEGKIVVPHSLQEQTKNGSIELPTLPNVEWIVL